MEGVACNTRGEDRKGPSIKPEEALVDVVEYIKTLLK
jgi:hypothetical protein